MDSVFFTADQHFGHRNILDFCNRPFASTDEMDQHLIDNWNAVVGKGDRVYVLGDISIGHKPVKMGEIYASLNGQKYLIAGNHDNPFRRHAIMTGEFEWIKDLFDLKVGDSDSEFGRQMIVLSHYPMASWNRAVHGSWMLHGHTHGGMSNGEMDVNVPNRLDVGMDVHDYAPVSYRGVKLLMQAQNRAANAVRRLREDLANE